VWTQSELNFGAFIVGLPKIPKDVRNIQFCKKVTVNNTEPYVFLFRANMHV